MIVFLLGLYLVIIIIRPMDWWEPVLYWQLVNIGAISVGLMGAPTLLKRSRMVWQQVPELKIATLFWIGLMMSQVAHLNFHATLLVIQEFGKVLFFFALILILIDNLRGVNTLLLALLVGITFLAIHAILQHNTGVGFGGKLPLTRGFDPSGAPVFQARAFGTFDDPNDLCLVLVVGIPLFYVLFKTSANPFQKLFALAGTILCTYGAWCTNSRGGIVSVMAMVGAFVIVRMRGIKRYLTAAFAFSVVTVLAPSRFAGGGGFLGKDRSELWGDGLIMFKNNPLFGVGFYAFEDNTSRHQVAHNSFIHTLAEGGLVGYLPFFLLLYLTMVHLRRLINQKQIISRVENQLLSGVFAALVGDFAGMYFISRQYQSILYALLGISIVMTYLISFRHDLVSQVFGPARKDFRAGLLFGLGSVIVMWITIRIVNVIS